MPSLWNKKPAAMLRVPPVCLPLQELPEDEQEETETPAAAVAAEVEAVAEANADKTEVGGGGWGGEERRFL